MPLTTGEDLIADLEKEFKNRKFAAGVLLSLASFIRDLGAAGGQYKTWEEFAAAFPPKTSTQQNKAANTLIVAKKGGGTLSIRKPYGIWEQTIRSTHKRFDFPKCAPHATQSWRDYTKWFPALLAMTPDQLQAFQQEVLANVLEWLPSHEFAGAVDPPPRRFTDLLLGFDFGKEPGEPAGGAFQGMVYAYIRADAPHLHLDVSKVGAGAKRMERVGDIDGWSGEQLLLSAEAKHFTFTESHLPDVTNFLSDTAKRGAMPLVVALGFDKSRQVLAGQGAIPVDLPDIMRTVAVWDPLKQESAFAAFEYYVHHIEKNMPLIKRLKAFKQASGI